MVVFQFDVFAEQPQLIPDYFVVELIFGDIFFQFIDADPGEVFSGEGRTLVLSFEDLILEG